MESAFYFQLQNIIKITSSKNTEGYWRGEFVQILTGVDL